MESRPTFHPKHLLCPVDMSELSDLALKYAHVGASVFNASLTVLHAMHFEYPRYLSKELSTRVLAELDNAKIAGRHEVEDHVRSVLGDIDNRKIGMAYQVTDAQPAEAVIQALSDKAIDLVVMGTHGLSGLKRWMLGSVTESVLHQSPVPVFIIRQKIDGFIDPSQPDSRPQISHILCPCNLTDNAALALEAATALSQRFKARLTVVCVTESDAIKLEDFMGWIKKTIGNAPDIDPVMQSGAPAEQIISLAKKQQCDIIVMGAHRKRFEQGRVMGRTTELVMRHAQVPVLAVPYH